MGKRISRAAPLVTASAIVTAVILLAGYDPRRRPHGGAPPGPDEATGAEVRPAGAVTAILEAFDRYPLVALGESHGLEEEREFIDTLVGDPRFPDRVQDIVVEFGNARYQDVLDRYVAGEEVPLAELQRVWRDHTCPGPWSSSAYPKYFAAFRAVNRALPPGRRFRVLLGDPPIDWRAVRAPQDFGRFLEQRDTHFARVVEEGVLAKGRKGLLIIGGMHLLRKEVAIADAGGKTFTHPPAPGDRPGAKEGDSSVPARGPAGPPGPGTGPDAGNVAQLIEGRHPGKLFIVLPHDGLGEGSAEVEKRFGGWPVPSVVRLKGTWLGAVAANQLTPSPRRQKMFLDGKLVDPPRPDPAKGPRLEEVADALLYLGPRDTLTSAPEADVSRDKEFVAELRRRGQATGGPIPPPAGASRKHTRRYIDP
jgi:hypothetical protein